MRVEWEMKWKTMDDDNDLHTSRFNGVVYLSTMLNRWFTHTDSSHTRTHFVAIPFAYHNQHFHTRAPFEHIKCEIRFNAKIQFWLHLIFFRFFFFPAGNHKDYNRQRQKEPQSPCDESIFPTGSRVPLARSCSSPAASYGKCANGIFM